TSQYSGSASEPTEEANDCVPGRRRIAIHSRRAGHERQPGTQIDSAAVRRGRRGGLCASGQEKRLWRGDGHSRESRSERLWARIIAVATESERGRPEPVGKN